MFIAIGYNPKSLKWWGNTVDYSGVDGSGVGILPIPARRYLGPEKVSFP
jgi:hypothetical protein